MKFKLYTLGCKVNTYESNMMRDILLENNYEEGEDADIVVINTCSVTNTADRKSMKMIHQARRKYPKSIIVVTGCMSQNKKEQVLKESDADIVLGNVGKSKIIEYIEEYKKEKQKKVDIHEMKKLPFESMRVKHWEQTRAFIKIQDGCNNFCSYCIIPYVRGNIRSKEPKEVIKEVQSFVEDGKKEIVLTGIHTGNYGADLGVSLSTLLLELVKIEGLERIRISSIEVTELDDTFLKVLEENPKIVSHLHIPLQSGSDTILKAMNRKYDKEYFLKKLKAIRNIRPDISITTDVIVGFPGETEENFLECIETIKQCKFTKIHVFPYSKREGTKAATFPNQISGEVKKERVHRLLELSKTLEIEYFKNYIGKEVLVLTEVEKDHMTIGHTGNYLEIKIKDQVGPGKLVTVHVDSLEYPYLIASKLTTK